MQEAGISKGYLSRKSLACLFATDLECACAGRHATALMHEGQPEQAAAVLAHYGAPKAAENYQLYHSIAEALLHKLLGTTTGKDLGDTALLPCHKFLHGLLVDAKANQVDYTVANQVDCCNPLNQA